jgi:hypothetical protein
MPRFFARAFCRLARATYILVGLAACGIGYALANPEPIGPTTNATRPASGADSPSAKYAPERSEKPLWTELSPAQQQALAPLSGEWDSLKARQKKKWLAISSRYASLKPDQQVRLQDRMRDWVKLTPEERRVARESYSRSKKLNPDQKAAEWQHYQQLSEDQKKKLFDDARTKKRITNLPPASQEKEKLTPPKSAPNSNARQSVESPLANEAAKPDSQQPSVK